MMDVEKGGGGRVISREVRAAIVCAGIDRCAKRVSEACIM